MLKQSSSNGREPPGALLARRTEEGMEPDDLLCSPNARSRTPLVGLMARVGVPVGGRVRKWRAVEDQSALILEEQRASLEGAVISLDARSEG